MKIGFLADLMITDDNRSMIFDDLIAKITEDEIVHLFLLGGITNSMADTNNFVSELRGEIGNKCNIYYVYGESEMIGPELNTYGMAFDFYPEGYVESKMTKITNDLYVYSYMGWFDGTLLECSDVENHYIVEKINLSKPYQTHNLDAIMDSIISNLEIALKEIPHDAKVILASHYAPYEEVILEKAVNDEQKVEVYTFGSNRIFKTFSENPKILEMYFGRTKLPFDAKVDGKRYANTSVESFVSEERNKIEEIIKTHKI